MTEEEIRAMAEEHWKFLEKWFHIIFIDAWMHSWKHAKDKYEKPNPV
jgi:hypothetical protein